MQRNMNHNSNRNLKRNLQLSLPSVIRWIARITGALILSFILFFLIAEIINNEPGSIPDRPVTDSIAFAFFPIGTLVGLCVAFKWEGPGGLILLTSLVGLLFIRPDLARSALLMSIFLTPTLLYLTYWLMTKKEVGQ